MEKIVEIPDGVDVSIEGNTLKVKGPKGELQREFPGKDLKIKIDGNTVLFVSETDRRKPKAITGTWAAHLRNMITGVTVGWEARLKALYSHFPMKLKVDGSRFIISNFLGQKADRKANIVDGTEVKVDKEEIIVTGIDRERVGQTAANIELASKVKKFDRRIFQDGCNLVQKTAPQSGE